MISVQKLLEYSIAWNALESICYQLILFSHQYATYQVLTGAQYGIIGTCFSLIYLAITISNVGLDYSIGPFFSFAASSRENAWRIIGKPLIVHLCSIGTIGIIASQCAPYIWPTTASMPLIILALIFLSESLKKTVRTLLHCAFKNSLTTLIELMTITSYICSVWSFYFLGYGLNIYTIFYPMMITSWVSLLVLSIVTYQWYCNLPAQGIIPPPHRRIIKHRIYSYGSQLSTLFFSTNFLVPLFAWKFGIEYAAVLKLISYFSYFIHTLMYKIFGVSLQACFSALKLEEVGIKRQFFASITNRLYQILYGIFIFFAINHQQILSLKSMPSHHSLALVGYLFLMGTLIENFLVSYEQLYQTEEKTAYLSILNGVNVAALAILVFSQVVIDPIAFLCTFIALRICTIIGIAAGAFHLWRIRFEWKPQAKPIFCFISASLFFFFLTT